MNYLNLPPTPLWRLNPTTNRVCWIVSLSAVFVIFKVVYVEGRSKFPTEKSNWKMFQTILQDLFNPVSHTTKPI